MTKQETKDLVGSLIRQMKWITYPQLLGYLRANGMNVDGTYELRSRPFQNPNIEIVLWGGLSQDVVNILQELIKEGDVLVLPFPLAAYQTGEPDLLKALSIPVIQSVQEAKEGIQFLPTCLGWKDLFL
ncbi:hypothetical protein [Geobacillus subterraneus]|uniref:Uncharacterized protein n=1 Tax=Geobacillus subterraneus TaxID=129338 RepID=A0A679FQP8_9BACL|nr:hypothetical protein [Geobacillus subterraneus]BBW98888.1 hypothetical protein GsuE55_37210 [Geobacillus subterraneus]